MIGEAIPTPPCCATWSLLDITTRQWIELTEAVLFPSTALISLSIAKMDTRGTPAAEARVDSEGLLFGGKRWRGVCLIQMRREAWAASLRMEGSSLNEVLMRELEGRRGEEARQPWKSPVESARSRSRTASWAT